MQLFILLAWRNLWRNKRRTIIASASIFFAILLALIMRSMQHGTYNYMIDSMVRMYTGYLQIHSKGYWEERSLEKSIQVEESQLQKIGKINHVSLVVPRLENFMLVSSEEITKVASIFSILPEIEDSLSKLKSKVVTGRYLNSDDEGILISEGLAKMLNVKVGDSIVLYGQGIYGITAAANSKIIGIIRFALPELNNTIVYLPLKYGQNLFGMENRLTSMSIMIDDLEKISFVKNEIEKLFDESFEVMTWDEMMPELVQGIQLDSVSGLIMLFILYMIVTFGILGTIMMMTAERTREYGILISIGMKKKWLMLTSLFESIFISLIGAFSGLIVAIPAIIYFSNYPIRFTGEVEELFLKFGFEPIIPFSTNPKIFFAHTLIVLAIAMLSALYPISYIRKLEPVKAIRI